MRTTKILAVSLALVLFLLFVAGCQNKPANNTENERLTAYPPNVDWRTILEFFEEELEDGYYIDASDMTPIIPEHAYPADIEFIQIEVRNNKKKACVIGWRLLIIEREVNGNWVEVDYRPFYAPYAQWGFGKPNSDNPNELFVSGQRIYLNDIYDKTIYKDGKMTPGKYRATMFICDEVYKIPFEIADA